MTSAEPITQLPIVQRHPVEIAREFQVLQDDRPITRVRTSVGDEVWMITRYEHVKALLGDPRLGHSHEDPQNAARFSDSVLLGGPMGDRSAEEQLEQRKRGLLAPAFSAARMKRLRDRVATRVDDLLEDMADLTPPVDLHRHLSMPLPAMVICELLGVPYADHDKIEEWSQGAAGWTDLGAAADAFQQLMDYVGAVVADKRQAPGEDLISDLIGADPTWNLTDGDIAALVAVVLFAGHESTVARIDLGTVLFLTHPDQRDLLMARPGLLPGAVEEVVRMSAPGDNGMPRYALTDVEIDGVTIRQGDGVLLAVTVANRDATVFRDPGRFDITRSPNPHLGFGFGMHFCIGATLARVELQATFGALFRRFPTLALAVPADQLRMRTDLFTGGLAEVPVTW